MHKGKETTTMPPKDSNQETESKKTEHQQEYKSISVEFKNQFSSEKDIENDNDENKSNKNKAEASRVAACRNLVQSRSTAAPNGSEGTVEDGGSGRERLKRHRVEVAGRVWIPDMWGQENLLKDWIDSTAFDAALVNSSIMSARAALVGEGRRTSSTRLRIENSC